MIKVLIKRSTYIPLKRESGPLAERQLEEGCMEGSFGTGKQNGTVHKRQDAF